MRTRMLGGVGGVRRNPAPIPIALLPAFSHFSRHNSARQQLDK